MVERHRVAGERLISDGILNGSDIRPTVGRRAGAVAARTTTSAPAAAIAAELVEVAAARAARTRAPAALRDVQPVRASTERRAPSRPVPSAPPPPRSPAGAVRARRAPVHDQRVRRRGCRQAPSASPFPGYVPGDLGQPAGAELVAAILQLLGDVQHEPRFAPPWGKPPSAAAIVERLAELSRSPPAAVPPAAMPLQGANDCG